MCICCCFCNCCNTYSSKCVELCILVLSSATFISTILGFVCIKWSHLTTVCHILIIIEILFSTCILMTSILINIFRCKGTINNKRNSFSTFMALICFILCMVILLLSFVIESLVQTNFKEIDYPCKDISTNDPNIINFRLLSLDSLTNEEKIQLCKTKTSNYNAKICSNLEYTMSYTTSAVIEACSLLLCFFFYNDYRRIRGKYDGELPIYDNPYLDKEIYGGGLNFKENGGHAESSDRNLNQKNLGQSNNVLVYNVDNNSRRKSQTLVLNKNNGQSSFIRNLRMEMKEALESLEEESSESKESKNEKKIINSIKEKKIEDSNGNKNENKNENINENINENKNNEMIENGNKEGIKID